MDLLNVIQNQDGTHSVTLNGPVTRPLVKDLLENQVTHALQKERKL